MATILMVVSAADSLTMKDGSQHPTGLLGRGAGGGAPGPARGGPHGGLRHSRRYQAHRGQGQPGGGGRGQRGEGGRLPHLSGHDRRRPFRAAGAGRRRHFRVRRGGSARRSRPHGRPVPGQDLGRILVEANGAGKIIAPFCHGPAGLLSATADDGAFAFAGRRMTVFSEFGRAGRRHRREHAVAGGDGPAREGRRRGDRARTGPASWCVTAT